MKKLLFYAFLAWILLYCHSAGAQQTLFHKITPPLGSFNGTVGGITQDNYGYIWIATNSGLYRYDGYRFKLYTHDPADENSLAANRLETIYRDREGKLWIATWVDGLDRLDPATGIFTHFRHNPGEPESLSNDTVRSMLEDRDSNLWIGNSGGLDRYDPKTGKFHNYHHDPNDLSSLSCNRIRKLYEDREGTLWVGTGSTWAGEAGETEEGGLNRFDKKTGKFIRYVHDPNNPHSLINNKVNAILEDSRGTFWVGTAGDGLHTMDRKTGSFQRHTYDPAHPEKLSRPVLKNIYGWDYIPAITEDALGSIWIGTLGNGVSRYDPKTDKMMHYSSKDTAIGFTGNSAWTFCNSHDGILWIATFEGNLFRTDLYHKNISHVFTGSAVSPFLEDGKGNFWIGTNEGLIFQNKGTGVTKKFVHVPRNPGSISDNIIISLLQDHAGTLWIGTLNGLNRFNEPSQTFTHYLSNPADPNSIGTGHLLVADAGGDSLWVGTNEGLDLMNKRTGTFTHFRNDPRDTNTLSRNATTALQRVASGKLWVGTLPGGGLNYFDPSTGKVKHFLKGTTIFTLCVDSSGRLWAGTQDDGVYRGNKAGNEFIKITDPGSGIEKIMVNATIQDDQNNIWVSSNRGIYRINPQTGHTAFFGANYSINAENLSLASCYRSRDGKLYFGDGNGYYVFAPREMTANPAPPQITFTDFRIGGRSFVSVKGSLLAAPLEQTKRITLDHDQNVIAFDFAAIHFSSPEQNRHLYKLENYDPEWREAGAEKTASYFNVPPGHYVFRVKAASSEGVWAERDLNIIISPPWWRTWWAYSLYGLLFMAGVFAFDRIQRRRIVARERARTKERELAQAREIEKAYHELKRTQAQLIQSEKMASLGELTAGVAHEIQNPLNFMNNFSEVNVELIAEMKQEIAKGNIEEVKAIANDIEDNEEKITHHGRRADAIVKGMLQHSRVSTGQKELVDINALTNEYLRLSYHGFKAKDKNFNTTINTDFDDSIGKVNIIPQDIGRVLLNLFNNAFYAVQQKKIQVDGTYEPSVSVTTKRLNGKIEIRVQDNGLGIPHKITDKIFQPFFTTKATGEGTGLGLSLSYDIVKAHGGELKVNSKEGEGAEFIIVLPILNS